MSIEVTQNQYHQTGSMIAEDWQHVQAAQQDLSKFEYLYKKYYAQIYEFVQRRVVEISDAIDVTSQVFEKAMINIHRYEHKGLPFGSWLYRIASNELGTFYRKHNKEMKLWIQSDGLHQIANEITDENIYENMQKPLLAALQKLDEADVQLIVMRFFEKREYAELAQIYNMTENNTRVKIHRILQKMKTYIGKEKNK